MKKQEASHQKEKGGFALLVVLFFVTAITTFLTMLAFSSSQRAFAARRLSDQIRAKAQAEAGCEYSYAILSTNWSARYTPTVFAKPGEETVAQASSESQTFSTAFSATGSASDDTSTYLIDVEPFGANSAIVTSTGYCGAAEAVSIISVQDIGGSDPDGDVLDGEAFNYAILSGGQMDFSGCGAIVASGGNAKFHSNSAMFVRGNTDPQIGLSSAVKIRVGNNVTVGGDLVAPNLQYNSTKVTIDGTASEESVGIVEIPDIDLTRYYNWALRRGEVHNGFDTSTSYTPNGGIMWVDGDVNISGFAQIYGSIIATGNITISGQASVTATSSAFAMASRDGEIKITSTGSMTGLIYAKTGGFTYTANGNINGQIIVNGEVNKSGNSDILTSYEQYIPTPPEGTVTTEFIAITAWQE